MNAKIPLKIVAERLSAQTDVTPDEAQTFLKDLFNVVTEQLLNGETVEIDGLGSFSTRIGLADPVKFTPSDEFSAEVNAPFAIFSPIEVGKDISDSELSLPDEPEVEMGAAIESDLSDSGKDDSSETRHEEMTSDSSPVINVMETPIDSEQPLPSVPENISNTEEMPEKTSDSPEADVTDTEAEAAEIVDIIPESEEILHESYIPEDEEEYVEYYDRPKSRFGIGFLAGLLTGLVIGALALAAYAIFFVGNVTL